MLTFAAPDGLAQQAGKDNPPAGKEEPAPPRSVYDLEIRDGMLIWNGPKRDDNAKRLPPSLEAVIDLLRELHPDANFALSPGVKDVVVGDLKMRASTVEEKLEAIRIASSSQFVWRNARPAGLPPTPGDISTPPFYVLDSLTTPAAPRLQVEVFNIGTYLSSFSTISGQGTPEQRAERLAQIERMAIETVHEYETVSMTLNRSQGRSLRSPSIRFHSGANLAVIMGEPEAVAVAAKVIGALPGAQRSVASDGGAVIGSDSAESAQRIADAIRKLQRDSALPAQRR
jgi:hypothetical protein